MLSKLLITALVIFIAYLVVRFRHQESQLNESDGLSSKMHLRLQGMQGALKAGAYALIGLLIIGSLLHLYQSWERKQDIVNVQVVNPYTGQVQRYQTRRGDLQGRIFRTLDGRTIRIADMERLVIEELP
ncbi:MAG TPA: hypothetical protein DDY14_13235 [Chromatiaceae bacterium]|jgi:hypothetical protein|nr:MAG: hypothetical protein N838_05565 [Thiohalocapsa sp. PB-PSB1]QQO56939.1 MAG: hypothetical protein N838_29905 [Thiohalocapsa sp. PB-PSB1]HBG96244.1 hypothetical protein [Chromatiaceae bacterium]